LLREMPDGNVRIIPTVMLLKSVGMARYINRQLSHIRIPEQLIDRIQNAPDKPRECVRIATETIWALREAGADGVLISTLGWEDQLPNILEV
ncbi:MAG: methylenetetrahydrofolate reductase, partial [Acidobacteriota bacterium]